MRLLSLSNFYPPASRGGYEQWCQEVSEGLVERGHEVIVLTSCYNREQVNGAGPRWVHRELHLEMDLVSLRNAVQFFTQRRRRVQKNLALLRRLIADWKPDVVLVWGMWNLPRALPALTEALMPGRVVYYMGDYWPTLPSQYEFYWQAPARNWLAALPKAALRFMAQRALAREELPILQFEHIIFPTAFMRDDFRRRGIPLGETQIIYGAVDTKPYRVHKERPARPQGTLSLLYAGRLTREKGVHTAIEAVGKLVREHGVAAVHLTIAGGGSPEYVSYLQRLIRQERLESFVTLLGVQPQEAMPDLYRQADILLFTSIWDEPFGRVLVEAMASGVIVVGTATGGAQELLVENENALLFPPGDADALAEQVVRLSRSASLCQRLSEEGRRIAGELFDVQRMTDEIEAYVQKVARAP